MVVLAGRPVGPTEVREARAIQVQDRAPQAQVRPTEATAPREAAAAGQEVSRPTGATVGMAARAPSGMQRTAPVVAVEVERAVQVTVPVARVVCMAAVLVGPATTIPAMELRAARASLC